MLLNRSTLERIRRGTQRLVFRTWRRPTVKAGGTLLTGIGQLNIISVEKVSPADLEESDAFEGGFTSFAALLQEVDSGREGDLYRIAVEWFGEDPRIALRDQDDLSEAEITQLIEKLRSLDERSTVSAWTKHVLAGIAVHAGMKAADLADRLGLEKEWLKVNVRKLKNLGLTESLSPGYRLSPRGDKLLKALSSEQS